MTPATHKKLLGLISEYGNSLTRIAAEKNLMKAMTARANQECEVPEAAFKKVAMAYWKNETKKAREEWNELLELLALFDKGESHGA